jgi:outer membrane protein assembly factor BamB
LESLRNEFVKPIIKEGITYSAGGDGRTGYVIASEVRTGTELWRANVFHIHINPFVEEDNQWIYISGMKVAGTRLLIQNEAGRCYRLDLAKHSVKKENCSEYLSIKP